MHCFTNYSPNTEFINCTGSYLQTVGAFNVICYVGRYASSVSNRWLIKVDFPEFGDPVTSVMNLKFGVWLSYVLLNAAALFSMVL